MAIITLSKTKKFEFRYILGFVLMGNRINGDRMTDLQDF